MKPCWLFALGSVVLCLTWTDTATACSCLGASPEEYVRRADVVFIGRAQAVEKRWLEATQPIEVLAAIKGRPATIYRHRFGGRSASTCDRRFDAGEVALVFVAKRRINVCDGNYTLDVMAPDLATYLDHGRKKPVRPPLAAVVHALFDALGKHLGDRERLVVHYPQLAGQTATIGRTEVVFTREAPADAVEIYQAVSRGSVHLVELSWPPMDVGARLLVWQHGKTIETLARWFGVRPPKHVAFP